MPSGPLFCLQCLMKASSARSSSSKERVYNGLWPCVLEHIKFGSRKATESRKDTSRLDLHYCTSHVYFSPPRCLLCCTQETCLLYPTLCCANQSLLTALDKATIIYQEVNTNSHRLSPTPSENVLYYVWVSPSLLPFLVPQIILRCHLVPGASMVPRI